MSERKIIRVSAESEETVREYAEAKGIQIGEAADALIGTAAARLAALKRYAANKQPQAPGKPKKSAAKKASKKTAAKADAKSGAAKKKLKKKAAAAANGAAAHAPEPVETTAEA